ncbi:hypothetical protein DL95DRAFT_454440 [Leptodontidium sp. 2 PMI_412]|nr:hypothetical protein DL95DRAFT_454440 [Leptodontidium sp. 2 PMI_412]
MIGMRSLAALATIVGVVYGTAVSAPEDEWHLALLKRQEPGTPLYECHSACGTAITLSRGPSPCTDNVFLTDYADCLVCSGPDNFNIWRYYGGTLTTAGSACGLSTTPVSGTPTTSSTSGPTTESTIALEPGTATTSSTSALTPTSESTTTPVSVSESASVTAASTQSTTSATLESASTVSPTDGPTYTPYSTGSVTTTAGNSTSTTVPFTGGANSANGKMAGALAVVAGAVFAAAL